MREYESIKYFAFCGLPAITRRPLPLGELSQNFLILAGGTVPNAPKEDIDALVDTIFGSTPLPFIQKFLREHRRRAKQVRIGSTRAEARTNLRDAVLAKRIGYADVVKWYDAVEGWGKQHVYLSKLPKRSLTHAHLLNVSALKGFLKKKGFLSEAKGAEEPGAHVLNDVFVDDEIARITWRSHAINPERCEEHDYVKTIDDEDYEFRAYRLSPRRSAARFIVRKTDGVVVELVDLPLGDDHATLRARIDEVARAVIAPLTIDAIPLSPIVSALDEGAVATFGPRAKRALSLGVAPTQTRFGTDGARVEFKSTREASGYTDSDAVRHVRRALRIEHFVGEAGKFRLTFEDEDHKPHDMIVSLHSSENRIYLFSLMSEDEVLTLVDQLITIRQ